MKRATNLFEQITSYSNIRTAWLKSLRGKRKSPAVIQFSCNVDSNLNKIQIKICSKNPGWGNYRQFKIFDPKERVISAVPFEQRIMHHAIINVLEPVFERQMIFHTYACRKGKGTQKALFQAQAFCRKSDYFLKLDIRKYFDTIDHDVLKASLFRIIKERKTLVLLYGIIDSYQTIPAQNGSSAKGLPIGNLTSQFFANMYLSSFDHYVLERLKPVGYVRYMDDMLLFGSKNELQQMLVLINEYIQNQCHLSLKKSVLSPNKNGIPFLGCMIFPSKITLLQKAKRRKRQKLRYIQHLFLLGTITELVAQSRITAVLAHKNKTNIFVQEYLLLETRKNFHKMK